MSFVEMKRILMAGIALATLSGCNVAGVRVTRSGLEPIYTAKQWQLPPSQPEPLAEAVAATPVVYHVDGYAHPKPSLAVQQAQARAFYDHQADGAMANWQASNAAWCGRMARNGGVPGIYTATFAGAGFIGPRFQIVRTVEIHAPVGVTLGLGENACVGKFEAADGTVYPAAFSLGGPLGLIFYVT
jgi:hypothetical protein